MTMPDQVEKTQHCPSCICGRRAPVQGDHGKRRRASGTVTWAEHEEAYTAYAAQYGTRQSAERLAERAGFGYQEMTELLGHEPTTWIANGVREISTPSASSSPEEGA